MIRLSTCLSQTALCGLASVTLLAGCGSDSKSVKAPPPSEAPPPRVETLKAGGLDEFRGSLVQSKSQLDSTLASLTDLTSPSQQNLQGAYDKYCDQLARMNEHAETMKREADGMRNSRDSYFGNWEQKVSEIDNPTIRTSAEARRKRLRDAHEQIVTASGEARDAYVPFMKDLQDIRKYLAGDLSKASVADLGDASKKVQASGAIVRQKLDTIIATLDSVKGG